MARRKMSHETIQQAAQKWAAGYSQAGPAIQRGVANPTRDPAQAAINAQNLLMTNWNNAVTSGRWAEGLARSGLAGWQAGMIGKTIPSLAARAQVGQAHYAAFLQQWIPPLQAMVQGMQPRGDYQTNRQRMLQVVDYMHSQRGRFRKVWRQGGAVPGGAFNLGGIAQQFGVGQ